MSRRGPAPLAVALRYRPGRDPAPRVAASGRGLLGERILALAREHGVPLREDPALAEALAGLPPGEAVPPALYLAVAEVLAFAYALREGFAERNDQEKGRADSDIGKKGC